MDLLDQRVRASNAANVSCVSSAEVHDNATTLGIDVQGVAVSNVNLQFEKKKK